MVYDDDEERNLIWVEAGTCNDRQRPFYLKTIGLNWSISE